MGSAAFSAMIAKDDVNGGWTYTVWPESPGFLSTRIAKDASAKVGNHEFMEAGEPQ